MITMRKIPGATLAVLLILAVMAFSPAVSAASEIASFDTTMTIREIAHPAGIKGGDLAESLGLTRDAAKDTPLSQLDPPRSRGSPWDHRRGHGSLP